MSHGITRHLPSVRLGIVALCALIAVWVSAPAVMPAQAKTAGGERYPDPHVHQQFLLWLLVLAPGRHNGNAAWLRIDRRQSELDNYRDDDSASRRGYVELRHINGQLRARVYRVHHTGECHQLHG